MLINRQLTKETIVPIYKGVDVHDKNTVIYTLTIDIQDIIGYQYKKNKKLNGQKY